jgi:hypothetical protein
MDRQLIPFQSQRHSAQLIHPNAPAGGCGPGSSRMPGPMCGSSSSPTLPHVGSPAGRYFEWRARLAATKTPYMIVGEFDARIRSARDLQELVQVASDLADVRSTFERQGVIRKPEDGDADVKEAVKSAITDQLGVLEKIIFSSAWTLYEKGVDDAIKEGFKVALWEVMKEIIEAWLGKLAKEVASAIKEREIKGVVKAAGAAAEALLKSLTDRDGLLRETIRIMRRNGLIVDKSIEYSLRRLLIDGLKEVGSALEAIVTLLRSPVIIVLKIFFTPSKVVDGSGELYLAFRSLSSQLASRLQEFQPSALGGQTSSAAANLRPISIGPTIGPMP